ncbi:MAG TPA: hypothetical protein VFH88_00685 [Candidatus Krumholzibacteria bacterium]|nr:hypothetical protein [Candidatus Krumholzibacteria bacterium]
MKRLLLIGILSAALASIYSFVYACDHSSKETRTEVKVHDKTSRTVVIGATIGCKGAPHAVVDMDIDVPGEAPHHIHVTSENCEQSSPSTLRTAITLGRAFMTTVEAVLGSIIDAATGRGTSLV